MNLQGKHLVVTGPRKIHQDDHQIVIDTIKAAMGTASGRAGDLEEYPASLTVGGAAGVDTIAFTAAVDWLMSHDGSTSRYKLRNFKLKVVVPGLIDKAPRAFFVAFHEARVRLEDPRGLRPDYLQLLQLNMDLSNHQSFTYRNGVMLSQAPVGDTVLLAFPGSNQTTRGTQDAITRATDAGIEIVRNPVRVQL